MLIRARSYLVPFVLAAMASSSFVLSGCGKEESAPAAEAPKGLMSDPVLREKLDGQLDARNDLAKTRNQLFTEMRAMVDKAKAAMPGADDAAVKAALEKDPAWRSLHARMLDVNTAIKENGRKTADIVREHTRQRKEISK